MLAVTAKRSSAVRQPGSPDCLGGPRQGFPKVVAINR